MLFIFPSRYLFTIGLVGIFSFQWSLPPTLGCNPKQPDSSTATDYTLRSGPTRYTGLSPSPAHYSKWTLPERAVHKVTILDYNSLTTHKAARDYQLEPIPFHSPLLWESLLVSFPPLSNMLKFSGYSCLI